MARRLKKRHTITVQATGDQFFRWEDTGRLYGRDIPAFLAFTGDLFTRYVREVLRGRSRPDPVLWRWDEKRLLEALVRTAKSCYHHLPAPFYAPISGQLQDLEKDLRAAVRAVERYWEEHGEAFGI